MSEGGGGRDVGGVLITLIAFAGVTVSLDQAEPICLWFVVGSS